MSLTFRPAAPADYDDVRRVTRDAYLSAGHFAADHPYMGVLEDVEHRAEHAEVWVAEKSDSVAAAVTLTFAGQPYSEIARAGELEFRMLAVDPAIQGGGVGRTVVRRVVEHARSLPEIGAISITSATFMERAHALYESVGSAVPRSGTGMCRARTCCCGCSGWSSRSRTLPVVEPVETDPVAARIPAPQRGFRR